MLLHGFGKLLSLEESQDRRSYMSLLLQEDHEIYEICEDQATVMCSSRISQLDLDCPTGKDKFHRLDGLRAVQPPTRVQLIVQSSTKPSEERIWPPKQQDRTSQTTRPVQPLTKKLPHIRKATNANIPNLKHTSNPPQKPKPLHPSHPLTASSLRRIPLIPLPKEPQNLLCKIHRPIKTITPLRILIRPRRTRPAMSQLKDLIMLYHVLVRSTGVGSSIVTP